MTKALAGCVSKDNIIDTETSSQFVIPMSAILSSTFVQPLSLGGISTEDPRFLALAHLQTLLSFDAVLGSAQASDAVLEMISALLRQDSACDLVQAFYRVRQYAEKHSYMTVFRLKRWMEQHIKVRVNAESWQPLHLGYRNYRQLVRSLKHHYWEFSETDILGFEQISVRFAWKQQAEILV